MWGYIVLFVTAVVAAYIKWEDIEVLHSQVISTQTHTAYSIASRTQGATAIKSIYYNLRQPEKIRHLLTCVVHVIPQLKC